MSVSNVQVVIFPVLSKVKLIDLRCVEHYCGQKKVNLLI